MELRPVTARTVTDATSLRATLLDVAGQGHAIVDQELEEGLRSVAAPILDATGHVIAAISVSVHASRVTLDAMRRTHLPILLDTAAAIRERPCLPQGPSSSVALRHHPDGHLCLTPDVQCQLAPGACGGQPRHPQANESLCYRARPRRHALSPTRG